VACKRPAPKPTGTFGAPTAVVTAAAAFGAVSFAVLSLGLYRRDDITRIMVRPVLFPSPKER